MKYSKLSLIFVLSLSLLLSACSQEKSPVQEKDNIPGSEALDELIDINKDYESLNQEIKEKLVSLENGLDIKEGRDALWWIDGDDNNILIQDQESLVVAKKENNFSDELYVIDRILKNNNYSLNKRNSSQSLDDDSFYDYIQAYEDDKNVCIAKASPDSSSVYCDSMCYGLTFVCASKEKLEKSRQEQLPFIKFLGLEDSVGTVKAQVGDFYNVSVSHRRTGHYAVLKKENNSFRELYRGQDLLLCSLIEKEGIPEEVSGKKCINNDNSIKNIRGE